MDVNKLLIDNVRNSIKCKETLLNNKIFIKLFNEVCEIVLNSYLKKGKLLIAGNGGSAADSQHLAAEFVSRLSIERGPLPAMALTVDTSAITAIANDYNFDYIFSRQIDALANKNDIFLGISTSGNSQNIKEAFKTCRDKNISSILLTGSSGGSCGEFADFVLNVPSEKTQVIQEAHILLYHTLCEFIEKSLFTD